ncbi:phosphonate ABC transporter ATP-binding protein [Pseudazoarcus pumilus]|uniref:Phosphonate ABC transporter ATP-binding protein n=1 Tax=Pseudazoarcus pumilus TaxID=2067960 RepID=A0A2I6S5Y1_9RHOO|nr:phosphonate ABC transporter ATP-binding protein [Pseudazoarcus pumilus]AUN94648.1 phosphonate ABC transporter ATP-binding protein [Pseudazoarcus pumilus]
MNTTATAPANPSSIVLTGVTKHYAGNTALSKVSMRVEPGEFVVLLGPSGAGKSTIFRCITALTAPDHGKVEVLGERIDQLGKRDLRIARRGIGLIFQQLNLIGRISALKNVLAGRLGYVPAWRVLLHLFPEQDRQQALANLDRVGLLNHAYQRADSLSGGQQQRVAIARALSQQSRVILADEPVSSLDPESSETVLEILRGISHERGIGVLCSLHQVDLAKRFADRIIGVRAGSVVFDGTAADLDDAALERIYRSRPSSEQHSSESSVELETQPEPA